MPVLSKMMVLTSLMDWSTLPPLMRIPMRAAIEEATITTAGVARPRAQGHDITITAIPNSVAKVNGDFC